MKRTRTVVFVLLISLIAQGCFFARMRSGIQPAGQTDSPPSPTSTPKPDSPAPLPTATNASVTETVPPLIATPSVRVIAFDGNLYIRRGPGTEYNRIGILKKGESAQVIGQDMLSKWVQVTIPNTELTGWVSLLTPFTKLDGDLSEVEAFTFTDWPEPAYIKNCTEHDLIIGPNELYLYNLYTNSRYLNEVQVDPGVYDIYDLFLPDEPKIQTVDLQEGETVYITMDGSGTEHLCP